jgi:hypothetical protein
MSDKQESSDLGKASAEPTPEMEPTSRWERRAQRRAERLERHGGAWVGGLVLIAVGVVLLLQNQGIATLRNWWALFLFIPAVGAFATAWKSYQQAGGRLAGPAAASLVGGTVLTLVAVAFLFNLNWGIVGPVLLVLAGIGALVGASRRA